MNTQPQPLWQHYMDRIESSPLCSEPYGRDRARVAALLVELYRLGERPTRAEVARYLADSFGPSDSPHRKTVLRLWTDRLNHPHRVPRSGGDGYPWAYPFVVAENAISEHDLEPVAARLLRQLHLAAEAHVAAWTTAPGSDTADDARAELKAATHVLILWGLVQDRVGDSWLSSTILPPYSLRKSMRHDTKSGRKRYEDWSERLKRERDAHENPARAD